MSGQTELRALVDSASKSHGLFTRQDAYRHNVSRQRLHSLTQRGVVEQLSHGVFRVAGSPASWEQRVLATVWAGGPDCVATGTTAAVLHGFDGVRRGPVEVLVPASRRDWKFANAVVHTTTSMLEIDRAVVGSIPVTDPIRTWLLLAATLQPRRLEELLDAAERDGLIQRRELMARLDGLRASGRNGVGVAATLLESRECVAEIAQSVLERRFARLLILAELPGARAQHPVRRGDGRMAYIDYAWPELRCGVELDGHGAHATRAQRSNDNRRHRELLRVDFEIIRFTWEEVTRTPELVVASVRSMLQRHSNRVEPNPFLQPSVKKP